MLIQLTNVRLNDKPDCPIAVDPESIVAVLVDGEGDTRIYFRGEKPNVEWVAVRESVDVVTARANEAIRLWS